MARNARLSLAPLAQSVFALADGNLLGNTRRGDPVYGFLAICLAAPRGSSALPEMGRAHVVRSCIECLLPNRDREGPGAVYFPKYESSNVTGVSFLTLSIAALINSGLSFFSTSGRASSNVLALRSSTLIM